MTDYTTPTAIQKIDKDGNLLDQLTDGWTPAFECPQSGIILRRGVPVGWQDEDRFSPMNSFAFSPLAQNLFSVDNGILALFLVKLYQKSPAELAKLASQYMDNVTKLLIAIVNTGKAHPLTAINATTLFSTVAHRFGILTDSGYLKVSDQTRSIIDKLIQLSAAGLAMDGLTSLVEHAQTGSEVGAAPAKGLGILADLKRLT